MRGDVHSFRAAFVSLGNFNPEGDALIFRVVALDLKFWPSRDLIPKLRCSDKGNGVDLFGTVFRLGDVKTRLATHQNPGHKKGRRAERIGLKAI